MLRTLAPSTFALSALALSALATTAAAQAVSSPSPPPPARVGWELGFGIYGGEINCENENGDFCDGMTEAGGIDLHANYFFTPTWGAYVDVFPMFHSEDNWTFTHNIVTAGLKWRPAPIFTFTAGLGSAQARLRYEVAGLQGEAETEVVGAILIGGAVEVLRGRGFALDVQGRVGVGFYRDDDNGNGEADVAGRNVGVGAAITWF